MIKENKLPSRVNNLLLELNEEQLSELNHKVVERIKLIQRAKSAMSMAKFHLLDKVYFFHKGEKKNEDRERIRGYLKNFRRRASFLR